MKKRISDLDKANNKKKEDKTCLTRHQEAAAL